MELDATCDLFAKRVMLRGTARGPHLIGRTTYRSNSCVGDFDRTNLSSRFVYVGSEGLAGLAGNADSSTHQDGGPCQY